MPLAPDRLTLLALVCGPALNSQGTAWSGAAITVSSLSITSLPASPPGTRPALLPPRATAPPSHSASPLSLQMQHILGPVYSLPRSHRVSRRAGYHVLQDVDTAEPSSPQDGGGSVDCIAATEALLEQFGDISIVGMPRPPAKEGSVSS